METTVSELINIFITTKKTEGRSEQTLFWYRKRLTYFAAHLGERAALKDLTLGSAREYVAALQSRDRRYTAHPMTPEREGGLSAATVHGHVRALKVFSRWLQEEGFTALDVLAKLKRPKLPETLIEVLTDQEIATLFADINPNCMLGARMYTIFMLLLDTGIRAEELCTLTVANTNTAENYIKVVGKGNKERKVNFGMATKKALLRYLTLWRPETEYNALFLTNDYKPFTYSALSQMIDHAGRRCGIPRLHTHLFRHTFAVRFLINGGDLVTLKTLMGHVDIATTQLYLKLTRQNIAEVYSRNSPMDRFDFKKKP
jgi:integrase/recombinase XerC/integrase/recombinase XerD